MAATSNADQVLAELLEVVHSFGFDATIEGKTLGHDCAGIVADRIAARSIDRESGADGAWDPNSDHPPGKGYRSWKARRYGVDKPNIRTGQMLSVESLLGQTTVTTHEVQMLYGTGRAPTGSATGQGFDPETDGAITDIEKAFFCSQSRPFYQLDDEISDAVFARVEECCKQYLTSHW